LAAALAVTGAWRGFLEMDPGTAREIPPLAGLVARQSAPGDLVIAFDDSNPRILYLSHRRGWVAGDDGFRNGAIGRARIAGARWIAGRYPDPDDRGEVREIREQLRNWRIIQDNGRVFLAGAGRR
jgi:hypothetical protein